MKAQETLSEMTDKVFEVLKEIVAEKEMSVQDFKLDVGTTQEQSKGVKFKINITLQT